MTLNGENSEMEIIIEVKIKYTPPLQVLDIINRMFPDDQKTEDKTKQPIRDKVKLNPALADPQPSQEVETARSPTTAAESQSVENSKLKPTESINVAATDLATEPQPLREIEKIDIEDYLHDPVAVTGFKNLSYAETKDKRLKIMYGSSRVNTTWADIHTICECKFKQQKKDAIERLVGPGSAKNKHTAVSRFVKAVSIGAVSPYKPKIPTDDDPDAVFEPVLSGVIDTHVDEGGGKAESHISEGY